jgi:hypothetical protein
MMVTTGLRNLSVGGYGYLRVSGRVSISNEVVAKGFKKFHPWLANFNTFFIVAFGCHSCMAYFVEHRV